MSQPEPTDHILSFELSRLSRARQPTPTFDVVGSSDIRVSAYPPPPPPFFLHSFTSFTSRLRFLRPLLLLLPFLPSLFASRDSIEFVTVVDPSYKSPDHLLVDTRVPSRPYRGKTVRCFPSVRLGSEQRPRTCRSFPLDLRRS